MDDEKDQIEIFAKELYYEFINRDGGGLAFVTKFDKLEQETQIGWFRVANYIYDNIEKIHQSERDLNHNGIGGYNR